MEVNGVTLLEVVSETVEDYEPFQNPEMFPCTTISSHVMMKIVIATIPMMKIMMIFAMMKLLK